MKILQALQDRRSMITARTRPCFVFVVCGGAAHIHELHQALEALRLHSRADIAVVTDSRRNEIPILWSNLIDVVTPAQLNHHQASIYLKTRVHRLVPGGRRYCYLDSDVFAISPGVDEIFTSIKTAVAFAADHSRLHEFSKYTVHCGCLESNEANQTNLKMILAQAYRTCDLSLCPPNTRWTAADYEVNAKKPLVRVLAYLRNLLTRRSRSQQVDLNSERWRSFWYEYHAKILYVPKTIIEFVEASSGWRRDHRRQSWISPAGDDVFHPYCNHLVTAIRETFGISVTRPRWQQWNGGVFLFDERGHAFLDAWHEKTMRIFTLPGWRTRDQGTLIATAWEFGLQDQPLLPPRFNCILDAHRGETMLARKGDAVTTDAFLTRVQPALVHVMWRSGDLSWDLWRWVQARASAKSQS